MDRVLASVPRWADENVLVGFDTADDAGVYKLTPELALVQTVDFFTPIVDDPYTYGAIAAANSLSDVYAMGGRPISALSILAWPAKEDPRDLEEILKGGAEKMHEAGCAILGGHSVADDEIKFGYAVTGTIHPVAHQGQRRRASGRCAGLHQAHRHRRHLDRPQARHRPRSRCRGIDCFHAHPESRGLRGDAALRRPRLHRRHRLRPDRPRARNGAGQPRHARKSMSIACSSCPARWSTRAPAPCPAASRTIANSPPASSRPQRELPPEIEDLLYDPQTSGGLLISLPESDAAKFTGGYRIGRVLPRAEKAIRLI